MTKITRSYQILLSTCDGNQNRYTGDATEHKGFLRSALSKYGILRYSRENTVGGKVIEE
jgi:hypothetical protein